MMIALAAFCTVVLRNLGHVGEENEEQVGEQETEGGDEEHQILLLKLFGHECWSWITFRGSLGERTKYGDRSRLRLIKHFNVLSN